MRKKKFTISKFRGWLLLTSKILGDVQAVRSPRKGAIERRVKRRVLGKLSGWIMRKLVK